MQLARDNADYNNLNYEVITSGDKYQFDGVKDPLVFLREIKKGRISIQEAKKMQKEFNKQLNFNEEEIKIKSKDKPLIILIIFIMQKIWQSNLLKIMVQ